jgi:pyruvate/2-oxoglutarate dehydrogenase complex dihydrolipoamide acyltransferase (E2) component
MKKTDFNTVRFPKSRFSTFDLGKIGSKKHIIAGLLEIDVTEVRKKIRIFRSTGNRISFMAVFLKSIAHSIIQHPQAHALMLKKSELILFNNIDIATVIEREVSGVRVPLATVIRKVNEKSAQEITAELNAAKSLKIKDESDYVIGGKFPKFLMKLYYSLPQFLRVFIMNRILRNPFRHKESMGTVMVTSVGMAGRLPGWIIPKTMHNLSFAVGAIVKKPWVVKNSIEIREILHLSVLFDHDVIDGVPAVRFVSDLVEYIEHGAPAEWPG